MSKRFTIKIMGQVFESDEDGFLNLNEIKNRLNLPESKKPSRWDNAFSRSFVESRNLVLKEIKHLGAGATKYYAGDEEATIGYAMFVSVDFYRAVIKAFVEVRRGNLEEAVLLAGSTMSKEDEYLLVKFAAMKGLCFTKSCWYANIHHPNKLLTYLKKNPNWKYFAENKYGRLYATDEGIEKGYTYNCYGEWDTEKVVMRFTQKGREMLRQHNQHFNKKVEESFDRL